MEKKNKKVLSIMIVAVLLIGLSISTAYFITSINNDKKEVLEVQTGTMKLIFDDNSDGVVAQLMLGESVTKELKIQNNGTLPVTTNLNWKDIKNSYLEKSLSYKVQYKTSEAGAWTDIRAERTTVPQSSRETELTILKDITIPKDATYFYKITITFENTDENQESDKDAMLATKFSLGDYHENITYKGVSNKDELAEAVANLVSGEVVMFKNDIVTEQDIPLSSTAPTIIDLNGHTFKSTSRYYTPIDNNQELIVKNGKLDLLSQSQSTGVISLRAGGSLTLENVNYTANKATGIMVRDNKASIKIIGSTITADGFALGTNANNVTKFGADTYDVNIEIKDSTINTVSTTDKNYYTTVLINVPCTLNMENANINGLVHGLVIRGGTAVIKDSTISTSVTDFTYNEWTTKYSGAWPNNGNAVALAALTIGNKESTAYQYPSNVTLINTKVSANCSESTETDIPEIYIAGNSAEGFGAALTYDEASVVGEVVRGNEFVTVNGS